MAKHATAERGPLASDRPQPPQIHLFSKLVPQLCELLYSHKQLLLAQLLCSHTPGTQRELLCSHTNSHQQALLVRHRGGGHHCVQAALALAANDEVVPLLAPPSAPTILNNPIRRGWEKGWRQ